MFGNLRKPPGSIARRRGCRLRLEPLEPRLLPAGYFVSTLGNDANPGTAALPFATIQHGLDVATTPGDSVTVRAGTYHEKISFPASGSRRGFITLAAAAGERPLLSGAGVEGENMVQMNNVNYVKLIGFEIADNTDVTDGSGVRVEGQGKSIEIRDNKIHDMRGENAMGITVYGTEDTPISGLVIDGNEIYDSEPAPSEALTLNGNVANFKVTRNVVHDVNNIGIDLIGGEKDVHRTQVARNGVVRGNTVYKARSNYGGGFAAGIYVDGGKDIVIENNRSYQNDMGIEVGAENKKVVASGIVVRNNLVYDNEKTGLVFGGFKKNRGRVQSSQFHQNVIFANGTLDEGHAQVEISYASNNSLTNNIVWAGNGNILLSTYGDSANNVLDHNLWHSPDGPNVTFTWMKETYDSFADYQAGSGQDAQSLFADPKFLDSIARDFHLQAGSPAIDAGSNIAGQFAAADFDGVARPQGSRPDIGAFEFVPAPAIPLAATSPAATTTNGFKKGLRSRSI